MAPILGRERLRRWVSGSSSTSSTTTSTSVEDGINEKDDERALKGEGEQRGRWAWVREWREKIRVPSRSRVGQREERRERWRREVEVLVREKEALPM